MQFDVEALAQDCDFEVDTKEPIRVWRAVDRDIEQFASAVRSQALEDAAKFLDEMAQQIPAETLGGALRLLPLAYAADLRRMK